MVEIDKIWSKFMDKNGQKKWPKMKKWPKKCPMAKTENKNGHEFWAWLSRFGQKYHIFI